MVLANMYIFQSGVLPHVREIYNKKIPMLNHSQFSLMGFKGTERVYIFTNRIIKRITCQHPMSVYVQFILPVHKLLKDLK